MTTRTADRSRISHQFKRERERPQEILSRKSSKRGGRTGDLPPQKEEPPAQDGISRESWEKVPHYLSGAPLKSTFKMQGGLCSTGKQDRVQKMAARGQRRMRLTRNQRCF